MAVEILSFSFIMLRIEKERGKESERESLNMCVYAYESGVRGLVLF